MMKEIIAAWAVTAGISFLNLVPGPKPGLPGAIRFAEAANHGLNVAYEAKQQLLAPGRIEVPIGGNTWSSDAPGERRRDRSNRISNEGIRGWTDTDVTFSTYVRFARKGSLQVSLNLSVPEGESKLELLINGRKQLLKVSGAQPFLQKAGKWKISDTGYVAITLRGISKTRAVFANVNSLLLEGTAIDEQTVCTKTNEGNFFYWGRRGPSVHLNYPLPEDINAEWFYNEVTVPEGEDVLGSYFMANGFGEGYFGFQVNSATERRILFSVWSPFHTDNPEDIPEDQRISLLAKGKEVHAGAFGNEGSGGQSYLRYPWKAGVTYRFLLHGKPDGKGNTSYTAFFYAPEEGEWRLIASFQRPKTDTWLQRFHSFLENFNPETGDKGRRVWFDNQWVADNQGQWTELTRARFTGDNTARKRYRLDYAGGLDGTHFYLRNCGFFNDYVPLDTWYERPATGRQPSVDLKKLLQKASPTER